MNVTIGVTNKRINSTGHTMTGTVSLTCRLKEPTSLHDPVFLVQGLNSLSAYKYNYANWSDRYYWIDDVICVTNDIAELHCHLDPLATFDYEIKHLNAYVEFSDSANRTDYKDDVRFGPDHKLLWSAGTGASGSASMGLTTDGTGTIIVVAQTSVSFAYTGITTYAMKMSTFIQMLKNFSGVVYSDITSWSGTDIIDVIKNYAIRLLTGGNQALDNIRSAVWVPINYSYFQSNCYQEMSTVYLGPYSVTLDTGTVCVVEPHRVTTGNAIINLGRPLVNTGHEWLNSPKYCSVQLTHPCGFVELNNYEVMETDKLYLWWALQPTKGEYVIRITTEATKDSMTVSTVSGNLAADMLYIVPPSGSTMDSYLHNAIDSAVTGVIVPGSQFNQGRATANQSSAQIGSQVGYDMMSPGAEIFWDIVYMQPSIMDGNTATNYNAFCNEYGYPCGKWLRVGSIAGYCKCAGANISGVAGATESDKAVINQYLNNGIYIE